jgi:hypothetical protein
VVLTRRLALPGFVLGLVLLGACSESLFGAGRGGGGQGGDGGGTVPSDCPEKCLGDAAADFDGTPGGKGGQWRYLEDHRDRTWTAMDGSVMAMKGAVPGNQITTCAANSDAPACKDLPGALLVSSAGALTPADPAIEFIAPEAQVIQLSLRVLMPSGAPQTIRLYRNSREDVLFTGTATAGIPLAHAITLDALKGDRFLVAVAPTGDGATNIGLHFFASAPAGASFPSTCQLALPFTSPSSSDTNDICSGASFTQYTYNGGPTPLVPASAPFPEQGDAILISSGRYLVPAFTHVLDWSNDVTLQFWVKVRSIQGYPYDAWVFDDHDPDLGGGIGVSIRSSSGSTSLGVTGCTDSSTQTFEDVFVPYPNYTSWQFIRVIRTSTGFTVCVNGSFAKLLPVVKLCTGTTFNPPYLGRAVTPSPQGAFFDGWLDDVRAITGALPCD